ncbi:MAG: ATP-binding protein [Hylemonella sp.]|nr:ATP-binding protein [Hylemonella sp.]
MIEPTPEQEIARLQAELQGARAALGDFTYAVSHDLRASLRHILSYAALLREEAGPVLPGEALTYLETVHGAARTLGQQIDGLMAWTQLDRVELQVREWEVRTLLAEAQAQLAELCAGRRIEWQVPEGLPVLIGDGALLRQLFVHLLSNALKFTRPRGTAMIEVAAQVTPDGLATIHVRDNGVGFDPVRQFKLFHVFHRLHGASQFEGLGLGLALARKIVERHGGSIGAEGVPDGGCTVSVTLPCAVGTPV